MANDLINASYIDRVHAALSDNLNGFDKSPDQFKQAMTDPYYVANVHAALADNLNGFDKPLEQFHANVADPKNPVTNVPAKQFFADYMQSPIYKQRLANMGITDSPDIKSLLNTHILMQKGYGSNQYSKEMSYAIGSDKNYRHSQGLDNLNVDPKNANINIDTNDINLMKKVYGLSDTPETLMAHELGHQVRELGTGDQVIINALRNKNTKNLNNKLGETWQHDDSPMENYADLNAIRYLMFKNNVYDSSKRNMTMDDFKNASQNKEIKNSALFKRTMQRFTPENFILLNNTIAMNKPVSDNTTA